MTLIPDDRTLGEWVRDARTEKNMTLREVASQLNLAPSYLSEIENDRRVPAEDALRRLTDVLQVDFDEAMARAGRFGEATERYLRRHPEAVSLMRQVSAANLSAEQLRKLNQAVQRIKHDKQQ